MPNRMRKKRHFTRTTSGCLTCRGRHIKCDEGYLVPERGGRPRGGPCLNCTRVNRDCVRRPMETIVFKTSSSSSSRQHQDAADMQDDSASDRAAADPLPSEEPSVSRRHATASPAHLGDVTDSPLSENSVLSNTGTPIPGSLSAELTSPMVEDETGPSTGPLSSGETPAAHALPRGNADSESPGNVASTLVSLGGFGSRWTPSSTVLTPPLHERQPEATLDLSAAGYSHVPSYSLLNDHATRQGSFAVTSEPAAEPRLSLEPSESETFECFHHYISHIAPWYDLWDDQKRFVRLLPRQALSCPPLLAACVAMGAKHLSRVSTFDSGREIQLYNEAIRRLMRALATGSRDAPSRAGADDMPLSGNGLYSHGQMLGTLLVMAQYEMCSHSNRNFRGHLAGVGRYISHHQLKPVFSDDGLLGAAFIIYARLDAYASYINLDITGIDPSSWQFPRMAEAACPTDEAWANRLLVIFAQIVNLRSRCAAEGTRPSMDAWLGCRQRLREWHEEAPPSFEPLVDGNHDDVDGPVWFVSSAITSAMQTYHSCWILLLLLKPVSGDILDAFRTIEPETQRHARRILAIARTNRSDMNIIVNGTQACHIAGRLLKTDTERAAALEILDDAERRTAWTTKWRIDALKVEWGWK